MTIESGRILIVDHSRSALAFQETILRRRRHVVMTALAGSQAFETAIREKPHLIIFGFDLFDMSGPEFCREIRGHHVTRPTSLLLVAERENENQADLCLSAGCNDVLYRPFEHRELDTKVLKLTSIPARRQLRTITKIEISIENNGRFLLGRSANISSRGMLLEVDRVLTGEGVIRLHFYLPGDAQPLQVDARILRAEFTGTIAKYGVEFINLPLAECERIDAYVRRLRSRELL